jgi:hypothetical protein
MNQAKQYRRKISNIALPRGIPKQELIAIGNRRAGITGTIASLTPA